MSLISMIRTIYFPTRTEWWVIFHPRAAVDRANDLADTVDHYKDLLAEREVMIRKLVATCNEYTLRLAKKGPNLQQVMELREKGRTEGAIAAYRHLKGKTDASPRAVPNED